MTPHSILLLGAAMAASGGETPPAGPAPEIYVERFDTVVVPLLPDGWGSSAARAEDGDFVTIASGANTAPGCVVSTNATIPQHLTSPPVDPGGLRDCRLSWSERRSASHDASVSVAVSIDGGLTFAGVTTEPLAPPGGTTYAARSLPLPGWSEGAGAIRIRWNVLGDGTGATGTLRIDDVVLSGRPAVDASLRGISASPQRPLAGESVSCSGIVVNDGFEGVPAVEIEWEVRTAAGSVAAPVGAGGSAVRTARGGPIVVGPLGPGDSAAFSFGFDRPGPGALLVEVAARCAGDRFPGNDTATLVLPAAASPGAIVVSEIMYDPLPGRPEYVELYNRSADPVDVGRWRLVDDASDSTGGVVGRAGSDGTRTILLPPAGFLVCSPDSGIRPAYPWIPEEAPVAGPFPGLTLNNGGDLLLLRDESGWTIDSVVYDPRWHTPALDDATGRSLERIEPGAPGNQAWNWGSSAGANGGTPGAPNSLRAGGRSRPDGGIVCSPNPFSPDGDGFEDVTVIAGDPGTGPAIARVRIFDAGGRLVRTLTSGTYVAGAGPFAWNGYDDGGRKVPIGIYVVLLDALEGTGEGAYTLRGVVVVAGRL